ncbi:MAG TPA: hypothetical protein VNO81_04985, partial [Candidatus Nitrosotenuis sp.]|nr:hypothetical protein [Candidatus Nitrosotenuis sp.]
LYHFYPLWTRPARGVFLKGVVRLSGTLERGTRPAVAALTPAQQGGPEGRLCFGRKRPRRKIVLNIASPQTLRLEISRLLRESKEKER